MAWIIYTATPRSDDSASVSDMYASLYCAGMVLIVGPPLTAGAATLGVAPTPLVDPLSWAPISSPKSTPPVQNYPMVFLEHLVHPPMVDGSLDAYWPHNCLLWGPLGYLSSPCSLATSLLPLVPYVGFPIQVTLVWL